MESAHTSRLGVHSQEQDTVVELSDGAQMTGSRKSVVAVLQSNSLLKEKIVSFLTFMGTKEMAQLLNI